MPAQEEKPALRRMNSVWLLFKGKFSNKDSFENSVLFSADLSLSAPGPSSMDYRSDERVALSTERAVQEKDVEL